MSKPSIKSGSANAREIISEHFGAEMQDGACYVRGTETWFGRCPDCLKWVRDGHFAMEAAVGVLIGRWAESNGATNEEVYDILEAYTNALRDLYGIDAMDDLDDPYDEAPDHKSRCEPILFVFKDMRH